MAPLYVCANCENKYAPLTTGVQMEPKENNVYVIEMADFGPYRVWDADLWVCPRCGHKVIAGFGLQPIAEHYQDIFARVLEKAQSSLGCYHC